MNVALKNDLEYSRNTLVSGQELLFDSSKIIVRNHRGHSISQDFYEEGYVLINDIPNVNEARTFLEAFISSIDDKRLPLYSEFINKIQLAKVNLIPICHDIVPRIFQALHFDMGQPIISESNQSMYVLLALYKPKTGKESSARTRVVSVKKLLSQKKLNDKNLVEERLINYARNHGDGWTEPNVVNTLRLACFGRVIDAMMGRNKLIDEIDYTTGQWFDYGNNSDGFSKEKLFFSECGFNLELAEEQINVKPGQLLIIDNMRCIHGRIGPRNPKEIYQFLFGVRSATPTMIADFREWLVGQL